MIYNFWYVLSSRTHHKDVVALGPLPSAAWLFTPASISAFSAPSWCVVLWFSSSHLSGSWRMKSKVHTCTQCYTYMYTYMVHTCIHICAYPHYTYMLHTHNTHTHTHTHACDCINHCAGMPSSYTIANTDLYICISHKSHAFSISTTLSSVLAFWESGRCGDNMFKVVLYHSQTSPYQPPPTNWVLDCIVHGGKDPLIATLTEKVWSLQHSQVLNCKILRYQTMMTITSHTCCV